MPLPPFDLADVAGKDFLLPMLLRAYAEVEKTLHAVNAKGGPQLAYQLTAAKDGMKKTAKKLAGLCNTEAAARMAKAERIFYETGLISAGVSPVTVTAPPQYRD